MTHSKKFLLIILIANILLGSLSAFAQKFIQPPVMSDNWSKDYEPFRIAGNVYYVGTYDLASYLIVTPAGNILINTGLAESAPMIKAHVEKLGFKFSDIKILLATHAHYDHVGAMAAVKEMTGAKMLIEESDAQVLGDGGNSDYSFGGKGATFEPVKADGLLHDGDTVKLGGTHVIVLHHPGHTKGASSFLIHTKDENRTYRIIIANMPTILDDTKPGMATYPEVGSEYASTLDKMRKLDFDLFLSSHASQFDLHKKHKPGDRYAPEVFIDRKGYDASLNELTKAYTKRFGNK